MKFLQYLSTLRAILSQSNPKRFVIGNSSADFDSIFGSLIYAFLLTTRINNPNNTGAPIYYLPLIDCNATDIALRFDVSYIMKKLQIDPKQLLYTSDIHYYDPQNVFYLYDHNSRDDDKITIKEIIDHHAFNQNQSSPKIENRIIYPVGSNLSLLYFLAKPKLLQSQQKKIQQALWPYMKNHNFIQDQQLDPVVQEIIRNGVLIDCFGFDIKQSQRWTQADKFLVETLQKQHKFSLSYEDLCELKFNEQMNLALTLQEHLRRDYKKYVYPQLGQVEYTIVCLDPDLFLQHYGEKLVEKFSDAQYQCYMIMFIWIKIPKSGNKQAMFGRETIFSISPEIQQERRVQIRDNIEKIFGLLKLQQNISFQNWHRWNDPSETVSRKKVDKYFRSLNFQGKNSKAQNQL